MSHVDQNSNVFACLKAKFPRINEIKRKGGIFLGPKIT
jgi:hypothetical protein